MTQAELEERVKLLEATLTILLSENGHLLVAGYDRVALFIEGRQLIDARHGNNTLELARDA